MTVQNEMKQKRLFLVSSNRFKQENEPIMQMLTSGLATSEFISSQYICDTENQSNLGPRKYFILNCKLIYILATETSTLSII